MREWPYLMDFFLTSQPIFMFAVYEFILLFLISHVLNFKLHLNNISRYSENIYHHINKMIQLPSITKKRTASFSHLLYSCASTSSFARINLIEGKATSPPHNCDHHPLWDSLHSTPTAPYLDWNFPRSRSIFKLCPRTAHAPFSFTRLMSDLPFSLKKEKENGKTGFRK